MRCPPFTLLALREPPTRPAARANISAAKPNPLRAQCLKELKVGDETYHYYSLPALQDARVGAYWPRLALDPRLVLIVAQSRCPIPSACCSSLLSATAMNSR